MADRHQVVIVGGGPVGVGLAVDLGLRGVSCIVVERRTALSSIPKGQGLAQRTLEHCWFWGVEPEIRAARVMPADHAIGQVTVYGDLTGEFWHAPPARELVAPYYFQTNERLPQYRTEEVLRNRMADPALRRLPVGLDGDGGRAGRRRRPGGRRTGRRAGGPRGRLRGRLRRRALAGPRAGRHRAQRHRLRRARGARGLPLEGAALLPRAVPRPVDLPRDAPRPRGLLDVLRPGRRGGGVLLPRPRAARRHGRHLRLHRPAAPRRRVRLRVRDRPRRLLGPAGPGRRPGTGRGGPSSPATRRTPTRPMAASDSTTASRTRPTSAGSWPRCCRAGAATRCWSPTAWNGSRCSGTWGRTSSAAGSGTTGRSWRRTARSATAEEFARAFEEQTKGFGRRLRDFEPHYEGSPVVLGPPGRRRQRPWQPHLRGPHRAPPAAAVALLGPERLRGTRRRLHAAGLRRRRGDRRVVRGGGRGPQRAAHRRPGHPCRRAGGLRVRSGPRPARPVRRMGGGRPSRHRPRAADGHRTP